MARVRTVKVEIELEERKGRWGWYSVPTISSHVRDRLERPKMLRLSIKRLSVSSEEARDGNG